MATAVDEFLRNFCRDEIDALLDIRAILAGALAILEENEVSDESEELQNVLRLVQRADRAIDQSIDRHDEGMSAARRLTTSNVVAFPAQAEGEEPQTT